MTEAQRGLAHGFLAYGLWGVVALYWRLLAHVDAVELVAHRAVWALGAFLLVALAAGQRTALVAALRTPRVVGVMAISATLIAINWTLFVWATNSGHLLDASLGYFINPLVSVALGALVLGERLTRLQLIAIALAAIGVAILTIRVDGVPWVALSLAGTFGTYGLVRKTAAVDALVGSTIETIVIAPVALVYLIAFAPRTAFGVDAATDALVIGTGFVTAIPLVLFTSAARRLPLSTVGFLQYLAPTGQFLIAVIVFGEPLATDRLAAFVLIWVALGVFSIELWRRSRRAGTR